jgi:hypothetical protein
LLNLLGLENAVTVAIKSGLDGLSTSGAVGTSGFCDHIDQAAGGLACEDGLRDLAWIK